MLRELTPPSVRHLRTYVAEAQALRQTRGQVDGWDLVRHFPRWRRSLAPGRSAIVDRQPWMVFSAIEFLTKTVTARDRVFEWGSGGSTLFFADRAAEVVTVEHDVGWAALMAEEVERGSRSQVELRHVPACATGVDRAPSCFTDYASAIDSYPAASFDIVVVDGRSRVDCVTHAVRRVREGGIIVLDNAERTEYQPAFDLLDGLGWDRREFIGPGPYVRYFWATVVWVAGS